jgi:hypothetical protein
MATLEELFEQFKQLPDWQNYPMPEVFYEHFKVKKPRPAEVQESLCYVTPPHHSLNKNGKIEERGPVEGGVREIKEFQQLPTEVKLLTEEGELVDYPEAKPKLSSQEMWPTMEAEFKLDDLIPDSIGKTGKETSLEIH